VSGQPLVCPGCGRGHGASERFCADCAMPLVHGPGPRPAASSHQRRARKIKPQYAEGRLVPVARAGNQIEAEFIEGLLLEEGIPCVLRAQIGGYAPVVGSREVLVPASGAEAAREALAWSPPGEGGSSQAGSASPS